VRHRKRAATGSPAGSASHFSTKPYAVAAPAIATIQGGREQGRADTQEYRRACRGLALEAGASVSTMRLPFLLWWYIVPINAKCVPSERFVIGPSLTSWEHHVPARSPSTVELACACGRLDALQAAIANGADRRLPGLSGSMLGAAHRTSRSRTCGDLPFRAPARRPRLPHDQRRHSAS